MKRLRLYALALALLLPGIAASTTARADCANPTAVEKKLAYNSTYHVYQFCDGTNWNEA